MMKRKQLYEGNNKVFYEGPDPGTLIQHFKDEASFLKNLQVISGKGVLNNRISELIMSGLNELGIPTHFIRRLNMREQLVHATDSIPLLLIVRNCVAGSLAKRFGLAEGTPLPRPLIEFFLKSKNLNSPLISEEHITTLGWATPSEVEEMTTIALRINDFLTGLFLGAGIKLVDFKLEFGRYFNPDEEDARLIIVDELSPDSCRLWDFKTGSKLAKDLSIDNLKEVGSSYQEVAQRLGVFMEKTSKVDLFSSTE